MSGVCCTSRALASQMAWGVAPSWAWGRSAACVRNRGGGSGGGSGGLRQRPTNGDGMHTLTCRRSGCFLMLLCKEPPAAAPPRCSPRRAPLLLCSPSCTGCRPNRLQLLLLRRLLLLTLQLPPGLLQKPPWLVVGGLRTAGSRRHKRKGDAACHAGPRCCCCPPTHSPPCPAVSK